MAPSLAPLLLAACVMLASTTGLASAACVWHAQETRAQCKPDANVALHFQPQTSQGKAEVVVLRATLEALSAAMADNRTLTLCKRAEIAGDDIAATWVALSKACSEIEKQYYCESTHTHSTSGNLCNWSAEAAKCHISPQGVGYVYFSKPKDQTAWADFNTCQQYTTQALCEAEP
ncbi:hypothetical protein FOA52_015646 [Chlamydomonas sp. UWO 241]|nr:hypothetical protein FOA52_015646 [Chlamydomonas sp. UWO 241]